MTDLEKHQKAIKILEAIDLATNRILSNESDLKKYSEINIFGLVNFRKKNIESLKKAKEKLTNYYNQNFKI